MGDVLALLRGVNVGGNGKLPMKELRAAMEDAGFEDVRTYIQSGNVIYRGERAVEAQAERLRDLIEDDFGFRPAIAAYTARQWCRVIDEAPDWWARDDDYRHNVIALIKPATPAQVIAALGDLRPEIEELEAGPRVIYQSIAVAGLTRARSAKLPGNPVYGAVTVRNHNTARKLAEMLRGRVQRSR